MSRLPLRLDEKSELFWQMSYLQVSFADTCRDKCLFFFFFELFDIEAKYYGGRILSEIRTKIYERKLCIYIFLQIFKSKKRDFEFSFRTTQYVRELGRILHRPQNYRGEIKSSACISRKLRTKTTQRRCATVVVVVVVAS